MTLLSLLVALNLHARESFVGRALPELRLSDEAADVDLSFARIGHFVLTHPNLGSLRAHGAQLSKMIFAEGTIRVVDATGAKLDRSRWLGGHLGLADFSGADLTNARFVSLEIERCSFDGAKLTGTRFTGVHARECSFRGATFNRASVLPFGTRTALDRGMIYVD